MPGTKTCSTKSKKEMPPTQRSSTRSISPGPWTELLIMTRPFQASFFQWYRSMMRRALSKGSSRVTSVSWYHLVTILIIDTSHTDCNYQAAHHLFIGPSAVGWDDGLPGFGYSCLADNYKIRHFMPDLLAYITTLVCLPFLAILHADLLVTRSSTSSVLMCAGRKRMQSIAGIISTMCSTPSS